MPWSGIDIERLQEATAEPEESTPQSASAEQGDEGEDADAEGGVDEEMKDQGDAGGDVGGRRSAKRRRVEQPQERGQQGGNGVEAQNTGFVYGDAQMQAQAVSAAAEDKIPFFKPSLADPDDKGENECFFDSCETRASGYSYIM